jgi:hypothetical protein
VPPRSLLATWALIAAVAYSPGCSRQDKRLQQHQERLESLGSTTATIAEAWLSGSTSGTYTRTAFEQTFMLVEQERTALAKTPDALLDPRGAYLSHASERLSRLLAAMQHDVAAADAASMRRRLAEIPIAPGKQT